MNGTAPNYLSGTLNIGSTGLGGTNFSLNKTITGGWLSSATYGVNMYSAGAVQSDVTAFAYYFVTRPSTAAAAFTVNNLISYSASVITKGAGSTISNTVGFWVESTHIGGTNNFGFYGSLGAATNTWNLYMAGTADNYLAGNLGVGANASPSAGPITSITLTNGGSGYADGTYTNVFFTSTGQSLYAQATFVVSGGIVTSATLLNGGSNYTVGQTLTTANTNLGGTGSGLIVTVTTVDSSVFRIQSTSSADISLFKYNINSSANDSLGSIKWEGND